MDPIDYHNGAATGAAGAPALPQKSHRIGAPAYTLGAFLGLHTLLHVDRSVVSVVMEPLKQEFSLTDSQLGLFGLAFAITFAMAGIPLGRLTDQVSRRRVLAGCIAVFSLATAACGLSQTWLQLLLARLVVGTGEAGARPAILSMLSDLYPAERRAFATSIYYLGIPLGFVLTFLIGGWLAGHIGWRSAFFVAGIPGLLAAMATLLLLREPARVSERGFAASEALTWGESIGSVLSSPAMRHVLATTVLTSMAGAGLVAWAMSFLVRSHGLTLTQAGLIMALAYGLVGAIGTITGGWAVDSLARRDVRWRAWAPAAAALVAMLAAAALTLAPSIALTAVALGVWAIATNWVYAPGIALTQTLAQPRARGTAASFFYLLSNLGGAGLGPLAVGVLSDVLKPAYGANSLRWAMLTLTLAYAWAALHFVLAGRCLPHELGSVGERA